MQEKTPRPRGRPRKARPSKAYTVRLDYELAGLVDGVVSTIQALDERVTVADIFEAIVHRFFFEPAAPGAVHGIAPRDLVELIKYLYTYADTRDLVGLERWYLMARPLTDDELADALKRHAEQLEARRPAVQRSTARLKLAQSVWSPADDEKRERQIEQYQQLVESTPTQ